MEIDNGRYRFIRRLGSGGTGIVYQAADTVLGRTVAVKALHPSISLELLRHEGRSLAQVSHPNIVALHDLVEWEGQPYLVMEYVDGCTLEEWVATRGPFGMETALALLRQVATAIDSAHHQGVLHCDLKPANILLTTAGGLKLADFTLARQEIRGGYDGINGSSAGFAAPEQLLQTELSPRTDVYALGALLAWMVASATGSALTPSIQRVIARACANNPADRFASVAEFAAALPDADVHLTHITAPSILAGLTRVAAVAPERNSPASEAPGGSWWWRLTGVCTALALAVVMLFTHFTASASSPPIALPDLVATQSSSATLVLRSYHLRTRILRQYSSVPTGIVIAQYPAAVSHVQVGDIINLTVSRGPKPVFVPAMVGQNVAAAQKLLRDRGLQAQVNTTDTIGHAGGEVLDQSLPAGSAQAPGSTVVLTVAQKPWWDLGGIL